ncbi:MAG: Gfo/Idh/MocA family oxidoreductase [Candidatus Marinimicrobia bacterium]|jgi:predicted dehydrogenase|nr:Gfo/Idh/MocA family oxidoreductase [Candidatus Neomarinimicrobiota bacterium]MBT4370185.1 Gfo/Idh/MocA family oxidoreductase [Candidatus Neomarinimicrobiota bacterium]MBT4661389.1 Gfo/Idh/MocA family oxidoreductase [Candidatus Neomarinimicrobiota bacterium]MBT4828450.1 Gfo/Idh/MocA family oxidoreductase [Candidatus Neomarinimicrobiota bacterium]MBT5223797.1 Gfo/Idh/MocA family oxidoreductase [Candidatus Neomarinimicrobiota bacterium]
MSKKINRRDFIKTTATASAAATVMPTSLFSSQANKRVKMGFMGTGMRGQWVLSLASKYPEVDIPAICDIDDGMIESALRILKDAGKPEPHVYKNGPEDFLNMVQNETLDGVYIATPWEWHHPMAIAAMKNGMHVGTEVPAALTVGDCWDLINVSERTGKLCMIMENVCYRRDVMAVLNMVQKGMFGELLHCQGGYQHDLRHVKFNDGKNPYGGGVEFGEKGFSEAKWRTQHSVDRNGDLYPTHGLGPVSTMLDINRGNRMVYLTSTATQSRGLHKYIVDKGGPDHSNADVEFKCGDIVTTVIKCANGQTIMLSHDTNNPRPYSLNFRVQGTNGIWQKDAQSIYIEGTSPEPHRWENEDEYLNKYDHPLWKRFSDAENTISHTGHGGMDFFIVRTFIETLKGADPVIDVYDAVSMSVICPLSEKSIRLGSTAVKIPDFTRGKWKENKPIFGLTAEY